MNDLRNWKVELAYHDEFRSYKYKRPMVALTAAAAIKAVLLDLINYVDEHDRSLDARMEFHVISVRGGAKYKPLDVAKQADIQEGLTTRVAWAGNEVEPAEVRK